MAESDVTGGCLCGAIRYRIRELGDLHYYCHCIDCRKYAGAGFHAGVVVQAPMLEVEGEPKVWALVAESGRDLARHFCPTCGGHLFTSPWPEPERYSVKPGTFDDPGLFQPHTEIWTQSRVDWALPPGDFTSHAKGRPPPK